MKKVTFSSVQSGVLLKQEGNGPINLCRQLKLVLALLASSEATAKQPQKSNLTSYFKSVTSVTLIAYVPVPPSSF